MATFGENFRREMERAGTNQTDVATRMATKKPTVSAWAKMDGTRIPDPRKLMALAAAIPCTVEALLDGIDPNYEAAKRRISQQDARRSAASGELIALTQREQIVVDGFRAMPHLAQEAQLEESQLYIDDQKGHQDDVSR